VDAILGNLAESGATPHQWATLYGFKERHSNASRLTVGKTGQLDSWASAY
jgi:hypothetical protein